MKRLKQKDPATIELERREQGFSLYLNGANTRAARRAAQEQRLRKEAKAKGSARTHPKTAGG